MPFHRKDAERYYLNLCEAATMTPTGGDTTANRAVSVSTGTAVVWLEKSHPRYLALVESTLSWYT